MKCFFYNGSYFSVLIMSGKFIFIILLSPFLAVVYCYDDIYANITFERNNKCGCVLEYTCSMCAPCEKLKPLCKLNNTEFKEFQPENLDDCKDWLLRGYNYELVNKSDGTLAVTLLLNRSREDTQYEVELRVVDHHYADNISSHRVHSNKLIRIAGQKSKNSSCEPVVSLAFKFLFSATYQLHVTRSRPSDSVSCACLSKQFVISSIFKKTYLKDLVPKFYAQNRPQSQELSFKAHFGKFSFGLQPYSTVVILKSHVQLRLNDCSGSGNEVAKYIMKGNDEVCCDSYGKHISQLDCPCKFEDGFDKITCVLKDVPNGDYCLVVGFYDPRCKLGTLWTPNADSCLWGYNFTVEGNETSEVYGVTLPPNSNGTFVFMCIFVGVILFLSIGTMLAYKQRCCGKLRNGIYSFTNNSSVTHSSDSSNISWTVKDGYDEIGGYPEILLLYPRDCRPFMKSMAGFRSLLKQCGCKVYDPWDDEIYDKVVEACESWTYPFITNSNVKIILVLSECSKRFEKAFLRNIILHYKDPETLDGVFTNSLAAIHQYFCNRFDSYQRIFVVQLEGTPSMNFEFITPATVYSIPQNIDYLINDLISCERGTGDLQVPPMAKPSVSALIDSIAEYKYFKREYSDYLSDILC